MIRQPTNLTQLCCGVSEIESRSVWKKECSFRCACPSHDMFDYFLVTLWVIVIPHLSFVFLIWNSQLLVRFFFELALSGGTQTTNNSNGIIRQVLCTIHTPGYIWAQRNSSEETSYTQLSLHQITLLSLFPFQADRLMFAIHLVHGMHPEMFEEKVLNSI